MLLHSEEEGRRLETFPQYAIRQERCGRWPSLVALFTVHSLEQLRMVPEGKGDEGGPLVLDEMDLCCYLAGLFSCSVVLQQQEFTNALRH